MKRSKPAKKRRKTKTVLTEIEKLDASYPTLAISVKALLDQGKPPQTIAAQINTGFGTSVTASTVSNFRAKRWVPEKERKALQRITIQSAVEAFGGDAGLDAAALAKLWELMDKMTIPQLLSARALFLKVRAQNLKEQEFLYKTGQLKPGQAGSEEPDPVTQQKNVLRRIKEIFGLVRDDETPAETPADGTENQHHPGAEGAGPPDLRRAAPELPCSPEEGGPAELPS